VEGDECEAMLRACDGSGTENLRTLLEKPWSGARRFRTFTADYSLDEMARILHVGGGLLLSPHWLERGPSADRVRRLAKDVTWRNAQKTFRKLRQAKNALEANGFLKARTFNIDKVEEETRRALWVAPNGRAAPESFRKLVARIADAIDKAKGAETKSPADALRKIVQQAGAWTSPHLLASGETSSEKSKKVSSAVAETAAARSPARPMLR